MTCVDLDSVVYPYLDGELEEADRKDFEDHLGSCASCAARVGGEAAFHGALRRSVRVQRAPAPEALRAMLHAGIQREHRRVHDPAPAQFEHELHLIDIVAGRCGHHGWGLLCA